MFPSPHAVAGADPGSLRMPQSRARSLIGLAAARELAERWRPYRAYAVIHLWADLATG